MALGDEHFAEHIRTRPRNPLPILYKYTTAETAYSILSSGKLRFQSPLLYNDPFDSQWDTLWPLSTLEAREYEQSLIENAIRDPASLPPDADPAIREALEWERARIALLPEDQHSGAIAAFAKRASENSSNPDPLIERVRDIRRRMRILCLCENGQSILMWSHYAFQHQGVMLGFDSAIMEHSFQRALEPIAYRDDLPHLIEPERWIRANVFGLPDRPVWKENVRDREWALCKHSGWQYEQEWRFVWNAPPGTEGEYAHYSFPPHALAEVVMGCRTDKTKAAELRALAQKLQPRVRFYQMSKHPSRFELLKTEFSLVKTD